MGCKVTVLCGPYREMCKLDDKTLTEEELKERMEWNEYSLYNNEEMRG